MKWLLPSTLAAIVTLTGCARVPSFPAAPMTRTLSGTAEVARAYDTDGSGRSDYIQKLAPPGKLDSGRIVELQYDSDEDGRIEHTIVLNRIKPPRPHVILMLDGIPYRLVDEYFRAGGLRLFYPPGKLISCFPSMTDLAFAEYFHSPPPAGWESEYFDPARNRIAGGSSEYLSGQNEPWTAHLTYRAGFFTDALAYLWPRETFQRELRQAKEKIDRALAQRPPPDKPIYAYFVSTAAMGTRLGRDGYLEILKQIDRLCEQLVFENRGRIQLSLLADHGHTLTPAKRISLNRYLKARGYRPREKIEGPRDVAIVEFGLVTYAAIGTQDPESVATEILKLPGTRLAIYPVGEKIIVRDAAGRAEISKMTLPEKKNHFRYRVLRGDPLNLQPILKTLQKTGKVDADGFVEARALLDATADHVFPDPLFRIWRGFHGLARSAPNLAVTFDDRHCHGSAFFSAFCTVASTHGSLNQANSAAFIMTTRIPAPGHLRLSEARKFLEKNTRIKTK